MSKNRKSILIIDDNPHILKPLSILLSGFGYSVELSPDENHPAMTKAPFPHLVLLDARLQGTKGEDICRSMKQNSKTEHIPIIMCSADSNIQTIAKNAGADDFIEKPFHIAELLKKIRKHI